MTSLAYVAPLCLILAIVGACSSAPPKPPLGPLPKEAIEVPYPPPPSRVETLPPSKEAGSVWIDGQWDWDGDAWRWLAGIWTKPVVGAYFTPWTTQRKMDGRLYLTRAGWRNKEGKLLDVGLDGRQCERPAQVVLDSGIPPELPLDSGFPLDASPFEGGAAGEIGQAPQQRANTTEASRP